MLLLAKFHHHPVNVAVLKMRRSCYFDLIFISHLGLIISTTTTMNTYFCTT
jgi:hypothetical protein